VAPTRNETTDSALDDVKEMEDIPSQGKSDDTDDTDTLDS
jgi:hypothetical protein